MSPPEVINGRYEVVGTIGVGGMGVLYRARDPWIGGRIVALKLLKDGLDDDEIRTRFKQEASAAGILEHENIVRIFDVGEHEGQPFIAMEYVDGDTLASLIREKVPVPLLKRLEWVEQLSTATSSR
ncbi:MAG: protein kinase [Vicinamibacterales bacterium]|nr:protein kinase [Vicinamibacterales bacterium]